MSEPLTCILPYITSCLGEKVVNARPVSGGDISSAYRVDTETRQYFLKVNSASFALEMFYSEREGLQAIGATKTIAVPHVHLVDSIEGKAFLLMDLVESKRPASSDHQRLGSQLARLHQCSQADFGFSSDNFIGSLPQQNNPHADWAEFYWFERILPQLQLALRDGLIQRNMIPEEERAITLFREISGDIKPALLHGDLWGGNYLIATDGTPYLIDPAVYYGHSMVDIAMSRLFGGFGSEFYDAYHQIIPQPVHYDIQIDLYQLYYLLVHLNLFGSGYYSSVSSILKRFF
ncbi:fructosamine kinase family protein [Proteiniphilum sp. X52]|uniref:fructosamine kinase family protein n=1 Tax=Proteiniphilum sp. X52 TaxID=2382159 RepID=UPI000F0A6F0C|nr:fructosamine kinase family protein [Proteiniphilum sp. X52]RNC63603.1 fructosamine kinase [Proteiniphilum sp. X52]